jgi:hypothetical protein
VTDRHPTGSIGSFYVPHPKPCPDPGCSVPLTLVRICLSTSFSGVTSVAVHLDRLPCTPLDELIQHKALLLTMLRHHSFHN